VSLVGTLGEGRQLEQLQMEGSLIETNWTLWQEQLGKREQEPLHSYSEDTLAIQSDIDWLDLTVIQIQKAE